VVVVFPREDADAAIVAIAEEIDPTAKITEIDISKKRHPLEIIFLHFSCNYIKRISHENIK